MSREPLDPRERGLKAFRGKRWEEAGQALAEADRGTPLDGDDLRALAWSAAYSGRDPEALALLERPVSYEPDQVEGVVANEPGLYTLGLHFQVAASSTMIHGAERDARLVATAIEKRRARA